MKAIGELAALLWFSEIKAKPAIQTAGQKLEKSIDQSC